MVFSRVREVGLHWDWPAGAGLTDRLLPRALAVSLVVSVLGRVKVTGGLVGGQRAREDVTTVREDKCNGNKVKV